MFNLEKNKIMFHAKPHQTWLFLRARRFKKTHVYFILHLFVGHAMQYNATNHKLQNVFTCFVIFRCLLVVDRAGQDTVVCDQLEKAEHGHELTMAVDLLHHKLSMVVFLLCHDLSMDVVLHHNLTHVTVIGLTLTLVIVVDIDGLDFLGLHHITIAEKVSPIHMRPFV